MNINELEQNVYYDEILNKIDNVYYYSENLKISPLFKEIIKQDLTNFPYVKELVMQNI